MYIFAALRLSSVISFLILIKEVKFAYANSLLSGVNASSFARTKKTEKGRNLKSPTINQYCFTKVREGAEMTI